MTPSEVLAYAREHEVRQIDLRFTDIPSLQHHVSYPISQLEESSFEEGFGMDGSSIRGWAAINESDMLLVPDPTTAFMDPFAEFPTLVVGSGTSSMSLSLMAAQPRILDPSMPKPSSNELSLNSLIG